MTETEICCVLETSLAPPPLPTRFFTSIDRAALSVRSQIEKHMPTVREWLITQSPYEYDRLPAEDRFDLVNALEEALASDKPLRLLSAWKNYVTRRQLALPYWTLHFVKLEHT